MIQPFALCVLLALGATTARAADSPPVPETSSAPAIASGRVLLATELDTLRPHLGQTVSVEGRLQRQGGNKGQTIRYLNFTPNYRDSVALVFFVEKGGDAFAKEKLTDWLGKKVRATGRLGEFGGNLQIEIEKFEQLQEIPEPQPAEPAKTP